MQLSENNDEIVHLDCPALSGLKFEHLLFGLGRQKKGRDSTRAVTIKKMRRWSSFERPEFITPQSLRGIL